MRIGNIGDVNNVSVVGDVPVAKGTAGQWEWKAASTVGVPAGCILPFAGSSAPTGFLLCDGATVSQTTYAALYAITGHTYGADPGGGNFKLPNLKGKVPVGYSAAEGEFDTLGETGGEKTHTLTEAELAAHVHNFLCNASTTGTSEVSKKGTSTSTTLDTSTAGSNTAHNNLQPYLTINYIIKI